MLDGKLEHVLGGLVTALVVVGLFAVLATLVRFIAHKKIGTRGYYTTAVVVGFLLHAAVLSIIPANEMSPSGGAATTQSNLDKRFIVPPKKNVEEFPFQLKSAISELSPTERKRVTDAIDFLNFSVRAHLADSDPAAFNELDRKDIAAESFVRLYQFARRQGDSMTLRRYIELAHDFKKHKLELWKKFQKINR